MFCEIGVLKNFTNFTRKHQCCSLFLIKLQAFRSETLHKETQTQVFSCEACEILKNKFFAELHRATASLTIYSEVKLVKEQQKRIVQCTQNEVVLLELLLKSYQSNLQEQPPELFCKSRCSQKFCKIHRKKPVPESLF